MLFEVNYHSMNRTTEFLVRRHIEYAKDRAEEVRLYDTIYDHMLYYFTHVLSIERDKAIAFIDDFRSDYILETALRQNK